MDRLRGRFLLWIAAYFIGALGHGQTTLVPYGATWRYLDDGSSQGTTWRASGFDDSAWANGPAELGYGDGDEATVVSFGPDANDKHITTYYRHSFVVADPTLWSGLRLELLRDDGAVVFLNGAQILRSNMPTGSYGSTTTAASTIAGIEETRPVVFYPAVGNLVVGTNTLAIEIHQRSGTSSDTSFDAELSGLFTPELARGPYLQSAFDTSMTVCFRLSEPLAGRVRYGIDPFNLNQEVLDLNVDDDHCVTLSGLQPATTYFYDVGTLTQVLDSGSELTVTTPPRRGARQPLRFWVLGDAGTADGFQFAVRDAFRNFAAGAPADLALMLGDNAYERGSDQEYQVAFFEPYAEELKSIPFWPARGNHEDFQAAYLNMFHLPSAGEAGGVPSGSELYYAFDRGNVHFVCLDSDSSNRAVGGPMWTWLEADLMATEQDWIVAYWHHPPYTKGSHDSDLELNLFQMRGNFLPLLETHGVDLVLSGHSHSYERSFLLDGHYGNSLTFGPDVVVDDGDGDPAGDGAYRKRNLGNRGAIYIVAGSSGKLTSAPLNHPAMQTSILSLGSVVVDVDDDRMEVRFLDTGTGILDSFVIEKPRVGGLVRDLRLGQPTSESFVVDGGLEAAGCGYWVVLRDREGRAWMQGEGVLDEVGTSSVELRRPPLEPAALGALELELELLVRTSVGLRACGPSQRLRW